VPELVELARSLPARSLILDGETISLRPDGRPQPFQVTMRRFGRRLDVDSMRADLPLSLYAFDCLHLDGEDFIDRPHVGAMGLISGGQRPRLGPQPRVVACGPRLFRRGEPAAMAQEEF